MIIECGDELSISLWVRGLFSGAQIWIAGSRSFRDAPQQPVWTYQLAVPGAADQFNS
jgi:hypothetical protein